MNNLKKFLVVLKKQSTFESFCFPEFKSLLQLGKIDLKEAFQDEIKEDQFPQNLLLLNESYFKDYPFIRMRLESSEKLQCIIKRSISILCVIELIAEGESYEQLVNNVDFNYWNPVLTNENNQIAFREYSLNIKRSQEMTVQRIDYLGDKLDFKGDINLKNPNTLFWLIEYHKENFKHDKSDVYKLQSIRKVFFGIEALAAKEYKDNKKNEKDDKYFWNNFSLNNRIYLGPTSTDEILAVFMTNQGQVTNENIVYDPFVGSGGLLIPSSYLGAECFGSDLDSRVLHGTGVGRINQQSQFFKDSKNHQLIKETKPKFILNFIQYGIKRPQIIRMDASNNSFRKYNQFFDAIICDPPYGIRATSRQSKNKVKQQNENSGEQLNENIDNQEINNDSQEIKNVNQEIDDNLNQKFKIQQQQQQQEQLELQLNKNEKQQQIESVQNQNSQQQQEEELKDEQINGINQTSQKSTSDYSQDQAQIEKKEQKKLRKQLKNKQKHQEIKEALKLIEDKESLNYYEQKQLKMQQKKEQQQEQKKEQQQEQNKESDQNQQELQVQNQKNNENQEKKQKQSVQIQKETKDQKGENEVANRTKFEIAETNELVRQLFDLADNCLIKGGFLIFLYPLFRKDMKENLQDNLPFDERFELTEYSENVLSRLYSRFLVTMRKK